MLLGKIILTSFFVGLARCDNFPSLLTTNATLAVVIDKEYLGDNYNAIKESVEDYLTYAKREILKHGGVNVIFYSWTSINLKRDISAIFSIASCTDTWKLFKIAEDENILHMAISENDCPRLPQDKAVTVPMIEKGQELPQLVLDLRTVNAYQWKSTVIIYDMTLDRDMVTRVVVSLTKEMPSLKSKSVAVSVIKLETNETQTYLRESVRNVLSSISTKTVGGNFLAVVSIDVVEILMEYAKQVGLVNIKNQWLYVISDSYKNGNDLSHLKKLLGEGDNVAFVYNTTTYDISCVSGMKCHTHEMLSAFAHALDSAVQQEFEIASQVSDEEWEAIRPSKVERRKFLLENVKRFHLQNGVCNNCTSWLLETGETWGKEYQKTNSETAANLLQVGSWRPSDGPALKDELFPHIAHGFRGITLPLLTFHNPPWQIIKTNENRSIVEYSGLVFDIVKELARNLNFTFTVEVIKLDNQHSLNNKSEKYDSTDITNVVTNSIPEIAVDLVRSKAVALAACAFTITEQDKLYLNFTSPVSTQTYTFLVSRPRELSRALLFMSPFTKDTWLCLAICIILMGPILYYIHHFSPVYKYKGISMKGGLSSVQNCMWYMYGALLQQGGMHLPYADSARIIVGSWWLVVLVVATTYCGNLVAFLTFPKIDIPITTIDELLAHKDTVTWSLIGGSFLEKQLQIAREPKFLRLYRGLQKREPNEDMIRDIEKGKHVFIDWKIRLQYIMKKRYMVTDRCDFAIGLDDFYDEQLGMAVPQNTPYLTTINEEIKKLHQVGLIHKWLTNYLPKRDRCWKVRHVAEVNNHTVNMDDMQGSFFVLFLGFLLSLFVIVGEKLWHRFQRKRDKKVIQPFMQ